VEEERELPDRIANETQAPARMRRGQQRLRPADILPAERAWA
jgi:hypothetical protein